MRVALRDHPRVCGEQLATSAGVSQSEGSSPRVRGTVLLKNNFTLVIRIIPACAGNSVSLPTSSQPDRDHPRVCGEQVISKSPLDSLIGSSPRVRGTDTGCLGCASHLRIIPACAGNRLCQVFNNLSTRDHPRVCGEQRNLRGKMSRREGSSPRVRGTDA